MNNKQRQKKMKALGYYSGKIDGIVGPLMKAGTLKMQTKYFPKKYRDGIPGPKTDILIDTLYNFRDIKHFKPSELKCSCGHCTGYPAVIDRQLLLNLEDLRKKNGAITITSGLRCAWYNKQLSGSIKNSKHTQGKAVDFYCKKLTSTKAKRTATVKAWKRYKRANYAYANTPNMGNAVHVDVR